MVIGPDKAKKATTKEIEEQVALLEARIDKELPKKFTGGTCVISVTNDFPWHTKAIAEIIRKYQAEGWGHVEYGSDQREGEWFQFYEFNELKPNADFH